MRPNALTSSTAKTDFAHAAHLGVPPPLAAAAAIAGFGDEEGAFGARSLDHGCTPLFIFLQEWICCLRIIRCLHSAHCPPQPSGTGCRFDFRYTLIKAYITCSMAMATWSEELGITEFAIRFPTSVNILRQIHAPPTTIPALLATFEAHLVVNFVTCLQLLWQVYCLRANVANDWRHL